MGLAEDVLALHDAIMDVLIVENRAGDLHVVDQAGTSDRSSFEAGKDWVIAPELILGAASQIGKVRKFGPLRLVGILYPQFGALCASIDDNSYLIATTSNEHLPTVMKALEAALPNLTRRRYAPSDSLTIDSAVDVDQAVRSFFSQTKLCEPNQVQMDEATLNRSERSWQVSGTYRPRHALRSKRYRVELDATTGHVTKFEAVA